MSSGGLEATGMLASWVGYSCMTVASSASVALRSFIMRSTCRALRMPSPVVA